MFQDCGCGCKGGVAKKRFLISMLSALVFFLIINKETFKFVRSLLGSWVSDQAGCPTVSGFALHTLVYGLVIFALMFGPKRDVVSVQEKLKISAFSALLFYIIANPNLFKFMDNILGGWVSDKAGCPTPQGSLLHMMVFLVITYAVMNGKRIKSPRQ